MDIKKTVTNAKQKWVNERSAGVAGGFAGAAIGLKMGGLGAAGLAIGGTALAIPAVAVVAIPAAAGIGIGVAGYYAAKKVNNKLKDWETETKENQND